jgi:phosphatidylglycerophosphate synthase
MAGRAVPDVATLRAICHTGKVSADSRLWYVLQRRASIYLTWLLLHTPLSPTHVTQISVGLAVLSGVLLAMPPAGIAIAGALGLAAHHLFDKVDGDMARFRRTYSIVGVYLDELGHAVAFAAVFLGLGLHLAWRTPAGDAQVAVLLAAALGALAMVLGRQHKSIGFLLYAQYVLAQPELLPRRRAAGPWSGLSRDAVHRDRRTGGASAGGVGRLRDVVLQLSDFSLMILLVLAGTIFEGATGRDAFLRWLLFAEAAFQGAVLVALVGLNAAVNVESEVARLDALVKGRDESEPAR